MKPGNPKSHEVTTPESWLNLPGGNPPNGEEFVNSAHAYLLTGHQAVLDGQSSPHDAARCFQHALTCYRSVLRRKPGVEVARGVCIGMRLAFIGMGETAKADSVNQLKEELESQMPHRFSPSMASSDSHEAGVNPTSGTTRSAADVVTELLGLI